MASVYLILSRSKTFVSQTVGLFTGEKYTHSSLSFDEHFNHNYSFGRRYARLALPAGLVEEGFGKGMYKLHPEIPCAIYRLETTPECIEKAREKIDGMMKEQKKYSYSLIGLANIHLGIVKKYPYKYFCSQFVAEVLKESGIAKIEKDPSLMKPKDLSEIEGLELIYEGTIGSAHREFNR
ncbi:MAG: hypothetical protein IJM15_04720 [Erysipelotrichaceae bacterium]|nr:hypothetical protein [Erysipelotrichaceae bacterium]